MGKRPEKHLVHPLEGSEVDLPVPEDGQDLLGRAETIDALDAKILLESPPIIAITSDYGYGKTSFLNLLLGRLRKLDDQARPIILKFNPWLLADQNRFRCRQILEKEKYQRNGLMKRHLLTWDFSATVEKAIHSRTELRLCKLRGPSINYQSAGRSRRKFHLTDTT